MTAQSVVVSLAHRLRCLCEQRGEDDAAHSWRGVQDRRVTLLGLPRFALLGLAEGSGELRELGLGLLELLGRQADRLQERQHMRLGRRDGGLRHGRGRRLEDGEQLVGIVTAYAMGLDEPGHLRARQRARHGRGGRHLQKLELPGHVVVALEPQKRGKIAPQLVVQAVHVAAQIVSVRFRHARELAQLDDLRVGRSEGAERLWIGPQGRGHSSASRLSSLAPATVKRSRKRSSCLGLMA